MRASVCRADGRPYVAKWRAIVAEAAFLRRILAAGCLTCSSALASPLPYELSAGVVDGNEDTSTTCTSTTCEEELAVEWALPPAECLRGDLTLLLLSSMKGGRRQPSVLRADPPQEKTRYRLSLAKPTP